MEKHVMSFEDVGTMTEKLASFCRRSNVLSEVEKTNICQFIKLRFKDQQINISLPPIPWYGICLNEALRYEETLSKTANDKVGLAELKSLRIFTFVFLVEKFARVEEGKLVSGTFTMAELIQRFDNNEFDSTVDNQVSAGWHDWFCKDTSLYRKTIVMMDLVKMAAASPAIDPDKVYVFFKNNCPVNGPLYDSFSICNFNGDVLYWVSLKDGHQRVSVIHKAPDFETNVLTKSGRRAIREYFKNLPQETSL